MFSFTKTAKRGRKIILGMKEKIVLTILGSDNFDNYSFFEEKLYEILGPYLEKKL